MGKPLNIAILIFDDVELLDFAGPFEVFSVVNRDIEPAPLNVFTVATTETVLARGGLKVHRAYSLAKCPIPDVLLIPGGAGIAHLLEDPAITRWVREQAANSEIVASVCTGAILLGRCGLLDGIEATTHHRCIAQLQKESPQCRVLTGQRFVDTGPVVTSAGISAGIDMSLHLVRRLIGSEVARDVALRMEYEPQ